MLGSVRQSYQPVGAVVGSSGALEHSLMFATERASPCRSKAT